MIISYPKALWNIEDLNPPTSPTSPPNSKDIFTGEHLLKKVIPLHPRPLSNISAVVKRTKRLRATRQGSESMFQPEILSPFCFPHDSKAGNSTPSFSSHLQEEWDGPFRSSSRARQRLSIGLKSARHARWWWNHVCTPVSLERSTTTERRGSQLLAGRFQATRRKTNVPWIRGTENPSVLLISSGGDILSRFLMRHNRTLTATNATHWPDSQRARACPPFSSCPLSFYFLHLMKQKEESMVNCSGKKLQRSQSFWWIWKSLEKLKMIPFPQISSIL